MPPPVSYLDITSLPYSRVITQAEFNGGSFGGVANQVWFRFVTASQVALGGYTNSGGTFTPKTTIYQSDGTTEIDHATGAIGWYLVLSAGTYYYKIVRSAGGASNFDFTVTNDTAPLNPTLPAGSIIINDDTGPLPATAWTIDGTFLGVLTTIPAGEIGDSLPNGRQLWQDRFGQYAAADTLSLLDASNAHVLNTTTSPAFAGFPLIAHDVTQFYVANTGTGGISTVSQSGVVSAVIATLAPAVVRASSLGVNQAGTIAYWAEGPDSPSIHRHDLVNDVPLSDLYTVPELNGGDVGWIAYTPTQKPGEILVLADDSIVTWYDNDTLGKNVIIHLDPSGTLLDSATFTGDYQFIDHMHYAPDNPLGIHVWFYKTADGLEGRIGHFVLSTGLLDVSFDIPLFSGGSDQVDSPIMFGPSSSCTLLTYLYEGVTPSTGGIEIVKVTDPTGSEQTFAFDVTGTGMTPPNFTLTDGTSVVFSDLTPGDGYSVIEATPGGWLTTYSVSNDSPIDALLVEAGLTTVVTVTNTSTGTGPGIPQEYLIRRERWWPHLSSEQFRQFFAMLQIDLQAGNGITAGPIDAPVQGENPLLELDWSDDGGHTWSNIHYIETGKLGAYRRRAIKRRMGYSRDRVYRIAVSDPNQWVIINGYLQAVLGVN